MLLTRSKEWHMALAWAVCAVYWTALAAIWCGKKDEDGNRTFFSGIKGTLLYDIGPVSALVLPQLIAVDTNVHIILTVGLFLGRTYAFE